jgi:4-hydroxybenzoate polyprenyltransferase
MSTSAEPIEERTPLPDDAERPPKWRVYLRLGRVSNLPTVWSNVVAGVVLADARPRLSQVVWLGVATSLLYAGGMFLNDAADHEIDAVQRPERPIPAGHIGAQEVARAGVVLLMAGIFVVLFGALGPRGEGSLMPGSAALTLGAVIMLYDAWHKGNPVSPLLMGLCRGLVYLMVGLAVNPAPGTALLAGALAVTAYVANLTLVSKQWRLERAVPFLLAGISLCDAVLIAAHGSPTMGVVAALGFPATLLAQRLVRGT